MIRQHYLARHSAKSRLLFLYLEHDLVVSRFDLNGQSRSPVIGLFQVNHIRLLMIVVRFAIDVFDFDHHFPFGRQWIGHELDDRHQEYDQGKT